MIERKSNIELLRIVSMLMVLTVHADFLALGAPSYKDLIISPYSTIVRIIVESLSIVCVNVFILISGWFKIRPSLKGLFNFLFQCLYYSIGLYIVACIWGFAKLSVYGLFKSMLMTSYWFVPAYMVLYVLSPVINSYICSVELKKEGVLLVVFYLVQSIFGWSGIAVFFELGYSALSFIGLYITADFLRKIFNRTQLLHRKFIFYFLIYISVAGIISICYYFQMVSGIDIHTFSYINPLVIFNSILLLVIFLNMRLRSKVVNFFSASSFSVYLVHLDKCVGLPFFLLIINSLRADGYNLLFFLKLSGFILIVFGVSIILDQPRKWIWSKLSLLIDKKLNNTYL